MTILVRLAASVMLLTVLACSPALNWRSVQPDGAGLVLMFPCKPDTESRAQPGPHGLPVSVHLASCKAQDWQFSLTWVDLGDPAAVPPALQRLHEALAAQAPLAASAPLALPGMTPHPWAQQLAFGAAAGASSPGAPRALNQAVFARGTRVYQLLLQGPRANGEAWDAFLGSVQLDS